MKTNKQPAPQTKNAKNASTHRPEKADNKKKLTEVTEVIDSLP